ncbi:hypothetical protein OG500_12600 [Kitasatospora sp. NBC_01250]|uniref:DUF6879 family protein n=1 Tax=Kitasatospora sp. NBC_01250 TaxID=2903571 RepID=UPI002E307D53|nr:DUF6879 family protein [Kitasatospora sp. NBC_01250]
MLLTGDDFNDLFQTFTSSAFKMETRDRYDVAGERAESDPTTGRYDMPETEGGGHGGNPALITPS